MIKVECPALSDEVLRELEERKSSKWNLRQSGKTLLDREVTTRLREAFHGKCGYCEGIEAETIDHFWPQVRYPDKIWEWENFVWACDVCQRRKGTSSPQHDAGYLMVNPREEEPLAHLYFDTSTGEIEAVNPRGDHTIQVLKLDRRAELAKERGRKYLRVRRLISRVIDVRLSSEQSNEAWLDLQDELAPTCPYLAIIQQLFTFPQDPDHSGVNIKVLLAELYRVRPEAEALFRSFRRPVPLVPPTDP